jgi:para-aminobenzoate synthetase component I
MCCPRHFPPDQCPGPPSRRRCTSSPTLRRLPHGPYCVAVGCVDADTSEAEPAVGIRTFWAERDATGQRWLRFGTGAGITWGSDPEQEWAETELKAARLIGLASGRVTM